MCLHLLRLLAVVTALSTVMAGIPLAPTTHEASSGACISSIHALGEDSGALCDESTVEEWEEEEVDDGVDLFAGHVAEIGLVIDRCGRATIAAVGRAPRRDQAMLPIRGPPA